MNKEPVTVVFEFARTDTPEDPHAFCYGPQDYSLRTRHGGRKRVHRDWSPEFLADLDALHQPYCDPAVVQRVGRVLYTFLESGSWSWHAQIIAGAVELSNTDIGRNLIDLVLASTQYRGNTRVITTAQQLLDELLNLRR